MEAAKAAKPNRTNRRGSRMDYSISPEGEKFKLPDEKDYRKEYERLFKLVERHRTEGHEIVVVMGLGFVGAVMAAVVADAVDKETGKPNKFVIGMQRPSVRSYWKIPLFNRGISPIKAEDPEVAPMIERCVNKKKTMTATFTYDALKLADVLVIDVQCDFLKQELGNLRSGHAEISAETHAGLNDDGVVRTIGIVFILGDSRGIGQRAGAASRRIDVDQNADRRVFAGIESTDGTGDDRCSRAGPLARRYIDQRCSSVQRIDKAVIPCVGIAQRQNNFGIWERFQQFRHK